MKRFRSAITGRFVTWLYARYFGDTTVSEEVTPRQATMDMPFERTQQCQFCGAYVIYSDVVCPKCHSELDEKGVPI